MSLTSIEEGDEPTDGAPPDGSASGVLGRLCVTLRAVVGRVASALGERSDGQASRASESRREGDSEASDVAIRPAGQACLDGGDVSRQLPQQVRSPRDDSEQQVEAVESDGRLRLQRADHSDTYVSSDVYERIER